MLADFAYRAAATPAAAHWTIDAMIVMVELRRAGKSSVAIAAALTTPAHEFTPNAIIGRAGRLIRGGFPLEKHANPSHPRPPPPPPPPPREAAGPPVPQWLGMAADALFRAQWESGTPGETLQGIWRRSYCAIRARRIALGLTPRDAWADRRKPAPDPAKPTPRISTITGGILATPPAARTPPGPEPFSRIPACPTVPIEAHTERMCRAVGTLGKFGVGTTYCSGKRIFGSSWCPDCRAVAYAVSHSRREWVPRGPAA